MCYIFCKSIDVATPAGFSLDSTFQAVLSGDNPAMQLHSAHDLRVTEPVMASLFNREALYKEIDPLTEDLPPHATLFERLCVYSARKALASTDVDPTSSSTLIILSSTKGNVDLLESDPNDPRLPLSHSARVIADALGNPNPPIVVSNACVSGVTALNTAANMMISHSYRNAIVIGCDLISRFIISGFQSFKALSLQPCRPFDVSRCGLNLGEAVATMILSAGDWNEIPVGAALLDGWSQHNDANHISGPSRTGEGMYRVLSDLIAGMPGSRPDNIAAIYAHGTATPYNDEMEAIAIDRAGLSSVPVSAVKGVLGHTLGAAGVIETALAIEATRRGQILPTHGFSSPGTSRQVNVSASPRTTNKNSFIKILSGFGGINAGAIWSMKRDVK